MILPRFSTTSMCPAPPMRVGVCSVGNKCWMVCHALHYREPADYFVRIEVVVRELKYSMTVIRKGSLLSMEPIQTRVVFQIQIGLLPYLRVPSSNNPLLQLPDFACATTLPSINSSLGPCLEGHCSAWHVRAQVFKFILY